ncbi:alkylated DNA repair protein alkB homolog 8 isoform X2 [Hyalella azteca]|uniref:Alkylated DNA repair protein alkB homolog 8 isoform X2 n=1 Tax=Hyalella azteca TaxID=294128 RepID=A0A8B7NBB6_HYAAZ|nr:alkylated DNA repair protein alkB homolog 8 isoform X2 [Hyalella azteca]
MSWNVNRQVSGYDETSILQLLHLHQAEKGSCQLALFPGKQYSFVQYTDEESANAALKTLTRDACTKEGLHQHSKVYACLVPSMPAVAWPTMHDCPPGLRLLEDFINVEEEHSLMNLIDWETAPSDSHLGGSLKNRSVRHFGYEFEYGSNSIDASCPLLAAPLPTELLAIMDRMVKQGTLQCMPDQITVNRYLPGQGIPAHTDSHGSCGSELASLSLGGPVLMNWTAPSRLLQQQREALSTDLPAADHDEILSPTDTLMGYNMLLPPRSLCVFSGEARYCWQHGIKARQYDVHHSSDGHLQLVKRQLRVSFTFRRSRRGPCDCPYKLFCPDQQSPPQNTSLSENDATAEVLEIRHVQSVYDNIAPHFSDTRHKPWPNVRQFIDGLSPGAWLLDVGCGNGKYLGLNASLLQVGCDNSTGLLSIAQGRGHETVLCNCLALPFRDASYDAVICIAVLHHLASPERRMAGLRELVRVLRSSGRGLVYVWALEQTMAHRPSSYLKQKTSKNAANVKTTEAAEMNGTPSLPVHENRTQFVQQDMFVPWKLKAKTSEASTSEIQQVYHRFYHTFRDGELEQMCSNIDDINILKSFYDEGNWCIIFEKK